MNPTTDIQKLIQMAQRMRLKALELALNAGNAGAHLGPALSCIEILAALYGSVMRVDPANPDSLDRDRFIASKAHCVLAHYTALAEIGFITEEELRFFEKDGSFLTGHPTMDLRHGFEYSGGSLGMALSVGIGMALDAMRKGRDNRVFILLGDGECDEGSNWEAFMAAPHFRLGNLVAIIDKNSLQYDGMTDNVMSLGDMTKKLDAFGWDTVSMDGHNMQALLSVLNERGAGRPRAIIANTVKGKGVSYMENVREWHHARLKKDQYDIAVKDVLEGFVC